MGSDEQVLMDISRRRIIIGLAASALLLCSGCAGFRSGSELNRAYADLNAQLKLAGTADPDQLTAIASQIRDRSVQLVSQYEDFANNYNEQASSRLVEAEKLQKLVTNYETERLRLRNQLLELQDRLHEELPADAWPEVREILNRKAQIFSTLNREG